MKGRKFTALVSAAAVLAVAVGATPVVAATAAWTVTVCRSSPASRLLAARLAARHGTGPAACHAGAVR